MKHQLMQVVRKPWFVPAGVGVLSFGAGAAAGYFLAMREYKELQEEAEQLTFDFEQLTEKIDDLPQPPVIINTLRDIPSKLETASRENHPSVVRDDDIDYNDQEDPEPEEGGTVVSIFEGVTTPDWSYDDELAARNPDIPYIIHRDEFFGDEMGWDSQSTLTYYEGDQILCNEQDTVIYNPDDIVGELRFGHGSGDPNVVYIRNEVLQAEYEVLREVGSYEILVMGGQVEAQMQADDLKHSQHPGKFKFE